MRRSLLSRIVPCLLLIAGSAQPQQITDSVPGASVDPSPRLLPTVHPTVPSELSAMWLAPENFPSRRPAVPSALARFARGVQAYAGGSYDQVLPLVDGEGLEKTSVELYAEYYSGLVNFRYGNIAEARRRFAELNARQATGYLQEASLLREAESAEALGDRTSAQRLY